MKRLLITAVSAIAAISLAASSYADVTVTYDALSLRGNGAFGADAMTGNGNIVLNDINGNAPSNTAVSANPLNFNLTVSNQDLDGDGMTNDSFSFTVVATGTGPNPRAFNQGVDTSFGMINGVTFSVANITGMTDQGRSIVFDGFNGATAGAGLNGDIDRFVEINGQLVDLDSGSTGSFQFITADVDFGSPAATVLFDNSGGTSGSIVARAFDLQFSSVSAIPEPSSAALLGLAGAMFVLRRRK